MSAEDTENVLLHFFPLVFLFSVLVKEADCCLSLSLNSGPLWGHSWTRAKSTLQTRPHSPAPFYPSEMSGLVRYNEFIGQATADCAFNFHIPCVSSFHLSSSTVRHIFPLTCSPFFPPFHFLPLLLLSSSTGRLRSLSKSASNLHKAS